MKSTYMYICFLGIINIYKGDGFWKIVIGNHVKNIYFLLIDKSNTGVATCTLDMKR